MSDSTNYASYARNICEKLEKTLEPKRYLHSLSVADTAACLAMRYGVDTYKAHLAGLLHDNAKCISNDKKLSICKKNGLSISKAEKSNPDLLHAKIGSLYAKEKFGIEDEEILSAICYHTTGKPEMTDLEKIVYIADYIEMYRKNLTCLDEIRTLAFKDLDECMHKILSVILNYLEEKKFEVDEITKVTFEYYDQLMKEKGELS